MLLDRLIDARDRARARKGEEGGFTLIELIVVIVIIGILAAIAIPVFQQARMRALQKQGKAGEPTPDPTPVAPVDTTPVDAASDPVAWGTIFGVIGVVAAVAIFFMAVGTFTVRAQRVRRTHANARATVVTKWDQAVAKHLSIKDAYGTLLLDPLNALTHSALWDVTNARTQAFHEVYARVQDIHALHPTGCPADPALVDEYADAVRKAETLWEDAVAHAARLGYDWMPHQDKTAARRATAMLKTAQNPAATEAERGLAATRAKELIDSIGVVRFKTETLMAVEAVVRLALPTGTSPTLSTEKTLA